MYCCSRECVRVNISVNSVLVRVYVSLYGLSLLLYTGGNNLLDFLFPDRGLNSALTLEFVTVLKSSVNISASYLAFVVVYV